VVPNPDSNRNTWSLLSSSSSYLFTSDNSFILQSIFTESRRRFELLLVDVACSYLKRDLCMFVDKEESTKRSELCWSLLSTLLDVSVGLSGSLLQRRVRSPFDLMEEV